jgi:SNF2 family DNA or RNA helicase
LLLTGSRNPTLEEQALARIHRIGQTREVTTVRFYVRDSFEEVSCLIFPYALIQALIQPQRVMELQASKKQLAGVLLSQHDGEVDDRVGSLHVSAAPELGSFGC